MMSVHKVYKLGHLCNARPLQLRPVNVPVETCKDVASQCCHSHACTKSCVHNRLNLMTGLITLVSSDWTHNHGEW